MNGSVRRLAALIVPALALSAPARGDVVHEYVSAALRGDLSEVAPALAALPDDAIPREQELARRFRSRFLDRDEALPVPPDPFVAEAVRTYRDYWRRVLLGESPPEEAEAELLARLDRILDGHPGATAAASTETPEPADEDVLDRLNRAVEAAGYGLISGRTLPHLELMLWARQDTTRYRVQLTDEERDVTVVFVGDFLVKGWAEFATFGRASTGGWATNDALFCLVDDYDLDSEKFRVSYLQHETRHFADYERFPELQQIDLEYRGKLTELCFARETQADLLEHFERAGRPDPGAPHSYANFAVIRDLRAELGAAAPEDWATAEPERIREAAGRLLESNTRALEAAGAKTVRGVVAPATDG